MFIEYSMVMFLSWAMRVTENVETESRNQFLKLTLTELKLTEPYLSSVISSTLAYSFLSRLVLLCVLLDCLSG